MANTVKKLNLQKEIGKVKNNIIDAVSDGRTEIHNRRCHSFLFFS